MKRTTYEAHAEKPGMTVQQLTQFLASMDGASITAVPKVRIYFGGGIKSIRCETERG